MITKKVAALMAPVVALPPTVKTARPAEVLGEVESSP